MKYGQLKFREAELVELKRKVYDALISDGNYTCATCGEWAATTRKERAEAGVNGVWFCTDCKAIERIDTFDYTDDRGAFGWL